MTTTDTIGVRSGQVMTVLGPIPVEAMGVTLMHEHILLDTSSWWRRPCCAAAAGAATACSTPPSGSASRC